MANALKMFVQALFVNAVASTVVELIIKVLQLRNQDNRLVFKV